MARYTDGFGGDSDGTYVGDTGQIGGRFDLAGRRRAGTTTKPTIAAGAAIGTSPTGVLVTGTDEHGTVAFTTGTSPTTGIVATLTFAQPYAATPHVLITAGDADSAAVKLYAVATTTVLTITAVVAPAAGAHKIAYSVVGGA